MTGNLTLVPILVLAAGTFAFRFGGTLLRDRVRMPERVRDLLGTGAIVLLVALIATSALTRGPAFAGWALPAGVLVGGLLAWRKAPCVVVVIAAAAATALLRLAGVA
ncbi:AzlD domain-containing protein [Actinokineospora auranticolor]|uniref:Branched-subunit amino acid transport protein n=1 Tax=Actinokineospora auranticolor TaxID=155976 RepID=A0A2S6GQ37_9PSEU|nr:AzlD domain-containing protein [Actinokineospora auranticolor]PPK67375.1 branched-subunit amino acid transport protein [Actinokineospora auranticolor]